MVDLPWLLVAILLAALAYACLGAHRLLRQRDDACDLAAEALSHRTLLQGELRRAAVATAALFDLLSLHYPWDSMARERAQAALVAWFTDPQDADARAVLEEAGIPPAWLDGAASILARPRDEEANAR